MVLRVEDKIALGTEKTVSLDFELFSKFDIDFILQFLKECDFFNKV